MPEKSLEEELNWKYDQFHKRVDWNDAKQILKRRKIEEHCRHKGKKQFLSALGKIGHFQRMKMRFGKHLKDKWRMKLKNHSILFSN